MVLLRVQIESSSFNGLFFVIVLLPLRLDNTSSSLSMWVSLILGIVFTEEIGFSLLSVGLHMYGLPSVSSYKFEGFIEFDCKLRLPPSFEL